MNEANWDPLPNERTYYSHVMTGDLGWMVRRDGKDCIRLDRPNQEIVKVFREGEWTPNLDHRPITKLQLVQVAYEADRKLCFFLGLHGEARREWAAMREQDRLKWAAHGPGAGPGRKLLFAQIMAALDFLAG